MRFTSSPLAALAAASLTLLFPSAALAGCFPDGEVWGDATAIGDAKAYADATCDGDLGGRDFNAYEERNSCFNLGTDKKVDFRMSYLGGDTTRYMDYNDCVGHLTQFVDNCEHGGNGESGPWGFRADPNDGQC